MRCKQDHCGASLYCELYHMAVGCRSFPLFFYESFKWSNTFLSNPISGFGKSLSFLVFALTKNCCQGKFSNLVHTCVAFYVLWEPSTFRVTHQLKEFSTVASQQQDLALISFFLDFIFPTNARLSRFETQHCRSRRQNGKAHLLSFTDSTLIKKLGSRHLKTLPVMRVLILSH